MIYSDHKYKHGIGWTICHMQWVTKYRYKVFGDARLKNLCRILLHEAAKRHNFELEEVEVQYDHVHVLAKLRPSLSPSRAINIMKGYTSRLLFMLEEGKLSKWYYKDHKERSLWSDGKFIGSVGHITLEKAKEYIQKQEAHHAESIKNPHPLGLGSINLGISPKGKSCLHVKDIEKLNLKILEKILKVGFKKFNGKFIDYKNLK